MKVSIVLAAYNIEKYVKQCLDSILESISPQDEIIVVDDGSTDSTTDIVLRAESKSPNITVFRKNNGGISSARNAGLALAKGDYVLFADGDDAFIPETYKVVRQLLERYTPGILVTDHLNWLNDGAGPCTESIKRTHPPFALSTDRRLNLRHTLTDCIPSTWTRFIRRDLFDYFPPNPFDETLMYDDLPLIPHITASANSLYYAPLPLIKYRARPDSITKSRSHRSCTDMVYAAAKACSAINRDKTFQTLSITADLMLARKTLEAIRQCRDVSNPTYMLYRSIILTAKNNYQNSPIKIYTTLKKSKSKTEKRAANHLIAYTFFRTLYILSQLLTAYGQRNKKKKYPSTQND